MHKKLMLICLLLLVGCTKVNDNGNYIESVQGCLKDHNHVNEVSLGYQYYLPKGVSKLRDYDYNQVFLIDHCYMYLYVDVVSYFYKSDLIASKKEEDYYCQSFDYKGKYGYIRILEDDQNQYYLSIVYHYSKMEGYVPKEKLTKVITLSSIILNSIEYNDTVIEKVLEGDLGQFSEFTYEVKKPDGASSNFSQYLEEYVQKEDETEQLPDE